MSLSYATGASPQQLALLTERYPYCPESLVQLLSYINGTYWQTYGEREISVLILGSDLSAYPYYLKSVEQILEKSPYGSSSINKLYGENMEGTPDVVGPAIDPIINIERWLCFSDCMNNGGTSQLFINFNPSENGVKGQVIRYIHDPDNYKVIAQNFDEYLQMLINEGFSVLDEEDE